MRLRKNDLALVYGKYTLLDKNNPHVYAYTREGEGKKMLIVLNFSPADAKTDIGLNTTKAKLLLCNYKDVRENNEEKIFITLRPYEARIYQLQ